MAFLHLKQCLAASGTRVSVQIHGIEGCQGVAGRPKGEPGFPRGPGAEQGTLSGALFFFSAPEGHRGHLCVSSEYHFFREYLGACGWIKENEGKSDLIQFSSVQSLSCVRLFATPWTIACHASLSITNSQSLLKPMSIESVMPSSHLILLLWPPIPPSIRVFSNESTLHMRWPMNTQD